MIFDDFTPQVLTLGAVILEYLGNVSTQENTFTGATQPLWLVTVAAHSPVIVEHVEDNGIVGPLEGDIEATY